MPKEISRSKMTVLPKQNYFNAYYELVVLQWWDGTMYECREKWRNLNGLACSSKSYRLKEGNEWQTWVAFKESNLQPEPIKEEIKLNDQPKLF
jgi:hypothetical protein